MYGLASVWSKRKKDVERNRLKGIFGSGGFISFILKINLKIEVTIMQTETINASNIEIINPKQIMYVHTYPIRETNGKDNVEIKITLCEDRAFYLKFTEKEHAESALREIYGSMVHDSPLFIIQYHRDCYGKPTKSDEAMVGGVQLNTVQEAFKNLKCARL